MALRNITPDKPSKVESIEQRIWYPSFDIKLKDIPEAKQWDVGKTYRLILEVEMKSIREDERKSSIGFDIKKVGSIKNNPKGEFKKMLLGGK